MVGRISGPGSLHDQAPFNQTIASKLSQSQYSTPIDSQPHRSLVLDSHHCLPIARVPGHVAREIVKAVVTEEKPPAADFCSAVDKQPNWRSILGHVRTEPEPPPGETQIGLGQGQAKLSHQMRMTLNRMTRTQCEFPLGLFCQTLSTSVG